MGEWGGGGGGVGGWELLLRCLALWEVHRIKSFCCILLLRSGFDGLGVGRSFFMLLLKETRAQGNRLCTSGQ